MKCTASDDRIEACVNFMDMAMPFAGKSEMGRGAAKFAPPVQARIACLALVQGFRGADC